ncbi:MAG TPA: polysaccharide deacetylase family protein [Telluria sp.]|nr:polysaccharide deacetylase family protein [Telluria sp.]
MKINDAAAPALDQKSFIPGKALIHALSPAGSNGLSILIYHRVLAHKDPLFPAEVDAVEFDHQIGLLRSMFNVIPLIDAVRHLRAGTLPARAACITFDDGYADNAEVALPILRRHGVHATFFVATSFLNGGRMWNDTVIELVRHAPAGVIDATSIGLGRHVVGSIAERQQAIGALIGQLKYLPVDARLAEVNRLVALVDVALCDTLMMTSAQVCQLHDAGMEIGGHTVHHPILAKLDSAHAREEMREGKLALEQIIGAPVRLFAYPNGKPGVDYCAEHVAMARELGFEGAVSTAWGASKSDPDPFQLPRFSPWDRTPLKFALRMAGNLRRRADRA